jgi:pimeloyl-ACP methyl ester carboxylesterase
MSSESTTPTVVLVHGAFADASSWARIMPRLLDAGVAARAIVNPLRGLTADGQYVAGVLTQTDGPVVLVGHSYGGPVITYASSEAHNVKALVYVASFGLDEGVSTNGSVEGFPPSNLPPALRPLSYPNGAEPGTEYYIDPELFPAVFAADLPVEEAKVLAYSQRPHPESGLANRSRSRPDGRKPRAGSSSPPPTERSTPTPSAPPPSE